MLLGQKPATLILWGTEEETEFAPYCTAVSESISSFIMLQKLVLELLKKRETSHCWAGCTHMQ